MTPYAMDHGRLRAKPVKRPNNSRPYSDLAPETAREMVARLMADGRERTSSDVAQRTGMSQGQARAALGWLWERGLLSGEPLLSGGPTITIYRRAGRQ